MDFCNRISRISLCIPEISWDGIYCCMPSSSTRSRVVDRLFGCTKSLLTRGSKLVFCEEVVEAAQVQLFLDYFSWNIKMALLFGMVGTNIILGTMVPIQQSAFRDFVRGEASLPYLLGVFVFSAIVHASNGVLCKKLRDDLSYEIREKILHSLHQVEKSARYIEIINSCGIKDVPFNVVFMTRELCQTLVNLANARLSTLSLFAGAIRSMYLNSEFISISFWGLAFEIPYLILVCFIYVWGANFASSWANAIFKKNIVDENNEMNELNMQLHNQEDGKTYRESNNSIHEINARSLLPQFGLSFINKINPGIGLVLGAVVQLGSNMVDPMTIMNTAQNFSYAAEQASWQRMHLESIKTLEAAAKRISDLLNAIDETKNTGEVLVT